MGDRCTGHCCTDFRLGYSPDQLRVVRRAWKKYQRTGKLPGWKSAVRRLYLPFGEDAYKVAEMAIPLRLTDRWPDNLIPPGPGEQRLPKGNWYYTCKHHLPSGDCGNYADRPVMCSSYPYGNNCRYKGCQSDSARANRCSDNALNTFGSRRTLSIYLERPVAESTRQP